VTVIDVSLNAEGYRDPTAAEALGNVAFEESLKSRKHYVFICSPYAGNVKQNILNAKRYLKFAVKKGVIPIAPHLLYPQVLYDSDPRQRKLGLYLGMAWLYKCDEMWVFGGYISPGMSAEIEKAKRVQIPIRFFTVNCKEVVRHEDCCRKQPYGTKVEES